jgi:type VII secretion integral membrane protein EccD
MTRPVGELCRLTVVAAEGQADVAIPGALSIGEILPTLVRSADPGLANRPNPANGWAVQRLGEGPLDEDGTIDSLGLRDGDILYLRPREAPLPPIVFDDLVDGVATAIEDRPDAWKPIMTRRLFVAMAGLLLAVVLTGLCCAGPVSARAGVAGVLSLALVCGGAMSSRALGERIFAILLGIAAIPFAFLSGLLLPTIGDHDAAGQASTAGVLGFAVGPVSGANVLAGGALAAVTALLAMVLLDLANSVFFTAVVTTVGISLGGVLAAWKHLDVVQASGVIGVLSFALGVLAPTTAARLVRLRLPQLPSDEDELQEDIDPTPGREVLGMSAQADSYLNSLTISGGLLCSGSVIVLAAADGWAAHSLVAVLSAAMLLRARVLIGGWQRMSAVLPGAVGSAALLLAFIRSSEPDVRPYVVFGISALTGMLLFGARYLPNRRLLPFWGRMADIFETLMGLLAVPILLQLLDIYSWARGLAG